MTYKIVGQIGSGDAPKLRRAAHCLGWFHIGRSRWHIPARFDWDPGSAAQLVADKAGVWAMLISPGLSASRSPKRPFEVSA